MRALELSYNMVSEVKTFIEIARSLSGLGWVTDLDG